VLVPGDPEREIHDHRILHGIPILQVVEAELRALGKKLDVQL
jgi:hypothetical protein